MCLITRNREFQTEGAAWQNERCPNVFVSRRVLVSEEERSCLDGK